MKFQTLLNALQVPATKESGESTFLRNKDIIPLPPSRRTWGVWTYTSFGCIQQICLSTWMAAPALLDNGLSVKNTMGVIVLGNAIIAISCIATGTIGATWHIGFTMHQRIIFGIYGSALGILMRIILSIVWFGSQAWLGGQCITVILSSWSRSFLTMKNTLPDSVHMTSRDLIGFVIFQVISIPVACIKPEYFNRPMIVANTFAFLCMLGITIWAGAQNGSAGTFMSKGGDTSYSTTLGWAWVYGITSWYGALSAGIANEADYTRFSSKRWDFVWGTVISTMTAGTLIPVFGLITASATGDLYGLDSTELYWSPLDLALQEWLGNDYSSKSRAGSFFMGLCFLMSQLFENTVGNSFAGGMDLSGLLPKYIDITRGAVATCLLSWVVQPWLFYNTSSSFLTVMSSFSVFLAPLIGVMCVDYFIIRKGAIKLQDLYTNHPSGTYYFTWGTNFRAILAWLVGCIPGVPGLASVANTSIVVPNGAMNYFRGNCLFGFFISSALYWALCYIFPLKNAGLYDLEDVYGTFTSKEAAALGVGVLGVESPVYEENEDQSEKS